MQFSVHLLLQSKDNLNLESYGEIGFVCLGKASIYVINGIIACAISFVQVMYGLLFGKICVSLAQNVLVNVNVNEQEQQSFGFFQTILMSKYFYIVVLSLILLPVILKRTIKELSFISRLQMIGLLSLIVIFFVKVCFKEQLTDPSDKIQPAYTNGNIIDSISIILTAYGFVINFYPIYSQLDKKTNKNGYLTSLIALLLSFSVYMIFSILATQIYGKNINPTVFDNLQYENNVASYFIRLIFLAIFICNMPFVFLPGKECLLTMIAEFQTGIVSKQIADRIRIRYQHQILNPEDDERTLNSPMELNDMNGENRLNLDFDLISNEKEKYQNSAQISQLMPNKIYNSVTIGFFTFQMVCAMLVDDITIVFGFFAAISESATIFFLPAIFYLVSTKLVKKKWDLFSAIGSFVFLILGTALFFFANYHSINKLKDQYD
eukprot:403367497